MFGITLAEKNALAQRTKNMLYAKAKIHTAPAFLQHEENVTMTC